TCDARPERYDEQRLRPRPARGDPPRLPVSSAPGHRQRSVPDATGHPLRVGPAIEAPTAYERAAGGTDSMAPRKRRRSRRPGVAAALTQYEAAWTVFQSLRDVLRLSAQGTSPLRDPYRLTATEQRTMFSSLQELREECRRRSTEDDDPQQRQLCDIVCTHLDR